MPLLTEHFSLQELSVTQQIGPDGRLLYNIPGDVETLYLRILAETILEPIRDLWGCPVRVTSGYRSPAVELAVSRKLYGQHMKGQAADIAPVGSLDLDEAYRRIWASALPYDQLLLEEAPRPDGSVARWIHVSCAPIFYPARREALVSHDNGRHFVGYSPPAAPQEGIA